MTQHHCWWHAWHRPLYPVQPRLTAEGIFFWVFIIWIYMATSFQTETNDLFFNNLTTFKTTWQEPPDPLGSSHRQTSHISQGLPAEAPRLSDAAGTANTCKCNASQLTNEIGKSFISARFTNQWKWQGRLPWIPIKSLTYEDKAELGQIMQKKRTRVSFREKRCHQKPQRKLKTIQTFG